MGNTKHISRDNSSPGYLHFKDHCPLKFRVFTKKTLGGCRIIVPTFPAMTILQVYSEVDKAEN